MDKQATIFIINEKEETQQSLKALVESVGLCVETYTSTHSYLESFDSMQAGCLILEVSMQGMSALSLQKKLNRKPLHPPIIMLTEHGDITTAVKAMKAGAFDFLDKNLNEQQLLDRIYAALGEDAKKRTKVLQLEKIQKRIDKLTQREKEVMELMITGLQSKNIAFHLKIALSTVNVHRRNVMRKMRASNLSDLMRMIISLGNKEGGGA